MSIAQARKENLQKFVNWAADHITGDEKGQAQIYLDRMFQAFGQKGVLEVGGHPEYRIRKDSESGGGTAFADYVWKPVVLIEMKKRGTDLSRHYRQAFDYWTRLVPGRPRYVVLCNFDEFWIYDFETQMDVPVDQLPLTELPDRYGPLAFLFPVPDKPVFGNDHEAVTRNTANCLAHCFTLLISRKIERPLAQRFVLQSLIALFAEDIGFLEPYTLTRLLDDCITPSDSYDLLGGLFEAMNTSRRATGGRYKDVPYFNGGIFADPARLELHPNEVNQLKQAAKSDWSKVRPEIFGTLFEHSLEDEKRRALGAHYTSAVDIMKIVGPTIVEPWREQIEGARTVKRLGELHERLSRFTVLDPACGSGNFLYIAYREIKRLEARIIERINEMAKKDESAQFRLTFVTARNFYGMDINPFAVELAKVTLMIARKLAEEELHLGENALPLDNLDANFVAGDALLDADGNPRSWPLAQSKKIDVIIGNPPFIGAKLLKPQHGPDYVNKLRRAYPDVPGMADYCVYWFRKASDYLVSCTPKDPMAGRAGLVGTQNIRNNQSRVGGLDHIVKTGTIVEAVDNQPWSGEANVHVSIVNWMNTQDAKILPAKQKLWYKIGLEKTAKRSKSDSGTTAKKYDLAFRECDNINSALSDEIDVSVAMRLQCNSKPQHVFQGITPGHKSFVLSPVERGVILKKDPNSIKVIFPYLIGDEILSGDGTPSRFLINFEQRAITDAQAFDGVFQHVKTFVLPTRMAKINEGQDSKGNVRSHHKQFLQRWWKLAWDRADMIAQIRKLPGRYIVCSRVTKRPIFEFVSSAIFPGDALQCFMFADHYSFGILQSQAHWRWFITNCSKLTERPRYTPPSVFDTFPWPQAPSTKQIESVAAAGCEIRRIRAEILPKTKGGLRALYRTLELPGKNPLKEAHHALDAAVLAAYGFSPKKDLLAQLLELNLDVARRIRENKPVTAPGIPANYPDPIALVTEDCIRPR